MLLYRAGALSQRTINGCLGMMEQYPFPIELSVLPTDFAKLLKVHEYAAMSDSGMGDVPVIRKNSLYGIVHHNFYPEHKDRRVFLFLQDLDDFDTIRKAYKDFVVSDHPFETLLDKIV